MAKKKSKSASKPKSMPVKKGVCTKLAFKDISFIEKIGLKTGKDYWFLSNDGAGRKTVFFNNISSELAQKLVDKYGGNTPAPIIA